MTFSFHSFAIHWEDLLSRSTIITITLKSCWLTKINMKSAVLAVLVALTATSVIEAAKSECRKVTPTKDLDPKWMDEMSELGWESPIGSKVESNLGVGGGLPKDNSTMRTKRCYKSSVKSTLAPILVNTDCRYDNVYSQICILKTEGTAAESLIKFYGDFDFTLTDNESYLVAYGCLMKNKVFWAGLIPKGTTMSDETRKLILEHVENEFKVSTDEKDMKSDTDPIQFGFTAGGSCAKKQKKADKKKKKVEALPDTGLTEDGPVGDLAGR